MADQNQNNKDPEIHVHTPVATGGVSEKSKFRKALAIFLEEDAGDIKSGVEGYVKDRAKSFGKDMKRRAKEFILDNITGAAEIFLFGKGKRSGSSSEHKTTEYNGQNIVYTSYYTGGDNARSAPVSNNVTSTRLKDIGAYTYGDAQRVVGELYATLRRYNVVSVSDYYQMFVDEEGKPLVSCSKEDFNFGWKELPGQIEIERRNNKYHLVLPRPVSIK